MTGENFFHERPHFSDAEIPFPRSIQYCLSKLIHL